MRCCFAAEAGAVHPLKGEDAPISTRKKPTTTKKEVDDALE
jgi:hypothetical protein